MDELNVVLEYRRKKPSWVCADCDTENNFANINCILCGRERADSDYIIEEWKSHESSMDEASSELIQNDIDKSVNFDEPIQEFEEDDSYFFWIIAGSVVLILILACAIAVNIWDPAMIVENIMNR